MNMEINIISSIGIIILIIKMKNFIEKLINYISSLEMRINYLEKNNVDQYYVNNIESRLKTVEKINNIKNNWLIDI